MKRGDIFWAILAPRSGSEQQGKRPVIIVSHDGFNQITSWRSIIVVPISTSNAQANRGPTVFLIPNGTAGLQRDSVGICHQVTTLDRGKLSTQIGALPQELIVKLNNALKAALDLVDI